MFEQIFDYIKAEIVSNQFFSGAALAGILGGIAYHSIIIPFERVVPVAILMQGLSRKLINLKQLN